MTPNAVLSCGCIAVCVCALSFGGGCVLTPTTAEGTETSEAALTDETFVLSGDDALDPDSRCETRTVLTLSTKTAGERELFPRGAVVYARLHEEATGNCKVFVDPNPREYALLDSGESCGSTIYGATSTLDGRAREITVTDHRSRVCKDFVPAKIIVEERAEDSTLRTLYSSDARRLIPSS